MQLRTGHWQVREQMTRSLHAPPWSCSFRDGRTSPSGFEYRYDCRAAAGGRAEGQARFVLRGRSEYEGTIEGRSHAIDSGTGAPLQSRRVTVRSLSLERWVAERCPVDAEEERSLDDIGQEPVAAHRVGLLARGMVSGSRSRSASADTSASR